MQIYRASSSLVKTTPRTDAMNRPLDILPRTDKSIPCSHARGREKPANPIREYQVVNKSKISAGLKYANVTHCTRALSSSTSTFDAAEAGGDLIPQSNQLGGQHDIAGCVVGGLGPPSVDRLLEHEPSGTTNVATTKDSDLMLDATAQLPLQTKTRRNKSKRKSSQSCSLDHVLDSASGQDDHNASPANLHCTIPTSHSPIGIKCSILAIAYAAAFVGVSYMGVNITFGRNVQTPVMYPDGKFSPDESASSTFFSTFDTSGRLELRDDVERSAAVPPALTEELASQESEMGDPFSLVSSHHDKQSSPYQHLLDYKDDPPVADQPSHRVKSVTDTPPQSQGSEVLLKKLFIPTHRSRVEISLQEVRVADILFDLFKKALEVQQASLPASPSSGEIGAYSNIFLGVDNKDMSTQEQAPTGISQFLSTIGPSYQQVPFGMALVVRSHNRLSTSNKPDMTESEKITHDPKLLRRRMFVPRILRSRSHSAIRDTVSGMGRGGVVKEPTIRATMPSIHDYFKGDIGLQRGTASKTMFEKCIQTSGNVALTVLGASLGAFVLRSTLWMIYIFFGTDLMFF